MTDSDAKMSVNISSKHFQNPLLPEKLLNTLAQNELVPSDLVVELTEATLLEGIDDNNRAAEAIVKTGVLISIDDFGTGYSSLAYLDQIPAKSVKLDKRFVDRIDRNARTMSHLFKLIHSLDMRVIAEGVESRGQSTLIQELGVALQQGYFHARPISLDE